MKKVVNIYPSFPITTVNPPIRGSVLKTKKSLEDIKKCIIARAKVEEVLNDGSTLLLNLNNYDRDNSVDLGAKGQRDEFINKVNTFSNISKKSKIQNAPKKENTVSLSGIKFITESIEHDDGTVEIPAKKELQDFQPTPAVEEAKVEDAPVAEVKEEEAKEEEVVGAEKPSYFYELPAAKRRKWNLKHGRPADEDVEAEAPAVVETKDAENM